MHVTLIARLLSMIVLLAVLPACGSIGKLIPLTGTPPPIDFALVLQYAQRSALVYEADTAIRQNAPAGTTIAIMPETPAGVKAYVETDDAHKLQWIVARGTSNLANVKLDIDYNKVVDPRLQIPLHKGFADAAVPIYRFAKPLLKPGYEVRVTGHSLGGAAALIVVMLLKEDGVALGQAITFGQPTVTNRAGVAKYRALPLLRVVNDKDLVPLLPPLDPLSVLSADVLTGTGS